MIALPGVLGYKLSQITTPVAVIAGRFDKQTHPDAQQALENATFHAFDAGHGLLFGLPEATKAVVEVISNPTAFHTPQRIETYR